MDAAAIAKVAFTSEDRVRDVIRNFNADRFGLLYPKYKGGRPPKFTLGQRREIKKIAKATPRPADASPIHTLAARVSYRRVWSLEVVEGAASPSFPAHHQRSADDEDKTR
jgi:transposase